MSYQLSIAVKDGVATIEQSPASPPPDGRFVIMGDGPTGDSQAENIMLERRGVNDSVVVQIFGNHQA